MAFLGLEPVRADKGWVVECTGEGELMDACAWFDEIER